MPGLFDHLLVVTMTLIIPLYGVHRLRGEMRAALTDPPEARIGQYWKTIVAQWGITMLMFILWMAHGRSLSAIGVIPWRPFDWRFFAGAMLIILGIGALVAHQRRILATEEGRISTREVVERLAPFLPRDQREFRHFSMLALTAGICEEILYRGYLFWYLGAFVGESTGAWIIIMIVGAALFAVAHLYQGPRGVLQVFVAGLAAGGIVLLHRLVAAAHNRACAGGSERRACWCSCARRAAARQTMIIHDDRTLSGHDMTSDDDPRNDAPTCDQDTTTPSSTSAVDLGDPNDDTRSS